MMMTATDDDDTEAERDAMVFVARLPTGFRRSVSTLALRVRTNLLLIENIR